MLSLIRADCLLTNDYVTEHLRLSCLQSFVTRPRLTVYAHNFRW